MKIELSRLTIAFSFLFACTSLGSADSLDVWQTSWTLGETVTNDTEYGYAELHYTGSSSLQFFNMVLNGEWVVRNEPIVSENGFGIAHDVFMPFNLGISRGTVISSANYGFDVTTSPIAAPAFGTSAGAVGAYFAEIGTGSVEESLSGAIPGLVGPALADGAATTVTYSHKDFPNQEQTKYGCAPAAISNSLKWLNNTYGMGMANANISIPAIETATHKTDKGVYINDGTDHKAFWKYKDDYIKGLGYNVTTTTTTSIVDIVKAMKDGKDVEIEMKGHTVAIVSISDLGGGKYKLQVAHDLKQGVAGGTVVEKIDYNSATGKFGGQTWAEGRGWNYAVIESVPEPTTIVALGLGALAVFRKRLQRKDR